MEQSPSWNLTGLQLVKKFPTFYGTRRFITALTRARHLSLSWASYIQSTTHFPKIHPNIILPSTPGSPQWSPSLSFPHQNPVHSSPLLHRRYMPCPSHSSWFYHPHNIGWGVQIIQWLELTLLKLNFQSTQVTKSVIICLIACFILTFIRHNFCLSYITFWQ